MRSRREQIGQTACLSGQSCRPCNRLDFSRLLLVLPSSCGHTHLLRHREAVREAVRGQRRARRRLVPRWGKHFISAGVPVPLQAVRRQNGHSGARVGDDRGRGGRACPRLAGCVSVSKTGCLVLVRAFLCHSTWHLCGWHDVAAERHARAVRRRAGGEVQ